MLRRWIEKNIYMRMHAVFILRAALSDNRGAVLAEYAVVLSVLSIAIWVVIQTLVFNIVTHVDNVATAAASVGAQGLPSVALPDSSL
jgi:Flp pilus assembly pilin Flp